MANNRVLLGFSGGIDSVKAVEVLENQGYEVIALTIDTMGDEVLVASARRKAEELLIPIVVEDAKSMFSEKVIQYFTQEYNKGRTPAPCTICNVEVKWKLLLELAIRERCSFIATGHYFNIKECGGIYYVAKANDPVKDQSYYLWGLSQEILCRAITPMATLIKSEFMGDLPKQKRTKESMGVCFLRGESCGDYLKKNCEAEISEGVVVNRDGVVIGRHSGFQLYTIGQKKGVETEVKGCVIGIESGANRLIWGENSELNYFNLEVGSYNIPNVIDLNKEITIKIRGYGNNPIMPIKKAEISEGRVNITLNDPAWAPALGQPVVMYCDDIVVGGGILEKYY